MSTPPARNMRPKPETNFEEYEETFKKGTVLEVSSDDPGLRGSWYTATVVRTISRTTRKILVDYHNLFADDAGTKHLREYVDAILVRPIPPLDPTRQFRVMEDVDAFHNDGWWEGVVTQVNHHHHRQEGSRSSCYYSVFFRCSREQIDFLPTDLRLHREWVRGDLWVPPLDHNRHSSSSSGQKRKNGGDRNDGMNGGRSAGANDWLTRNGDGRELARRSGNSPSKQGGGLAGDGGSGVVTMNGGGREGNRSSTRSISNGVVARKKQRISASNIARIKVGVTRNGTLKDPRSRSSNPRVASLDSLWLPLRP